MMLKLMLNTRIKMHNIAFKALAYLGQRSLKLE